MADKKKKDIKPLKPSQKVNDEITLTAEQVRERLKGTQLVVCTPCYGGMVNERYLQSMFTLVAACANYGVGLSLVTMANESLVTRARNELVNNFLALGDRATHMMFIDADISFKATSVIEMLLANKDVVTGAYPLKEIMWPSVQNLLKENPNASLEDIQKIAVPYVINVSKPDPKKVGQKESVTIVGGLIEVWDAGTGFMLMKRDVLLKMIEAYPETKYYTDRDMTVPKEERVRHALFDTVIDEDGRYLSEDYTFCRRWQAIDGKIHLAVNVVLDHVGTHIFRGRSIVSVDE
jgi:hypothetical protein